MPLYQGSETLIRNNLVLISNGDRAPMIKIGCFTDQQFHDLNTQRAGQGLHLLVDNEILFIGKHLYKSRLDDGYSIDDMISQIVSSMSNASLPYTTDIVTYMENPSGRSDGYGNMVNDRAVFEMTAKKPKAELFSVQPKRDYNKPQK